MFSCIHSARQAKAKIEEREIYAAAKDAAKEMLSGVRKAAFDEDGVR